MLFTIIDNFIYILIFIVISLISVTLQQCDRSNYVVTFNFKHEPFWFQKCFGSSINGNVIPGVQINTIHVFPEIHTDEISEISNFPNVTQINMEKLKLKKLPKLINMKSLNKVTFYVNNITKIEKNFLQNSPVKTLIISSNLINTIEDKAIGESVSELFLTCNNLTKLSPKWFRNPLSIKELHFGGNKITEIPENMFKDFKNLRKLILRNNEILTLGSGSLSGPTFMNTLHLAYNNISDIKPDVFAPEINISRMDIQYNELSFLHQGLMDKLNVENLRIWGNPWQCPCLPIIYNWLSKTGNDYSVGIIRDEDPSCVIAQQFSKNCVPFVDNELYTLFLKSFEKYPVNICAL